jgi:hypothetical protein
MHKGAPRPVSREARRPAIPRGPTADGLGLAFPAGAELNEPFGGSHQNHVEQLDQQSLPRTHAARSCLQDLVDHSLDTRELGRGMVSHNR